MMVEHDFKDIEEMRDIKKWSDRELGIEYEVDREGLTGEGTIVWYEMEPDEYRSLMAFLRERGYLENDKGAT